MDSGMHYCDSPEYFYLCISSGTLVTVSYSPSYLVLAFGFTSPLPLPAPLVLSFLRVADLDDRGDVLDVGRYRVQAGCLCE